MQVQEGRVQAQLKLKIYPCIAGAIARLLAHNEALVLDRMAGRYRECTAAGCSTAGCSTALCSTEASNKAAAI